MTYADAVLQRILLWLAPVSGLFLMIVSCIPIANTGAYVDRTMAERGDPHYSASQISQTIAPMLVLCWVGLITALMVITVVLPMQGCRAGPLSTSDRAFTIAAIVYMVAPMALLIWFATSEGAFSRSIAYHYLPWYVPMLVAGTAVYTLALIGALVIGRPCARSM